MEYLYLKAATQTVTDEGVFEAVISTISVDRERDVVVPEAMVRALKKWNRPIPLSWHHSTKAEDIFGHIEPMTIRLDGDEVVAQGKVDLESKVGMEAWRSFKNRTVGFSFGYLIPDGGAKDREGGGRHITELDVFEVTATPTPMNNDTRVLSTKSTEELREDAERTERELNDEKVEKTKAAADVGPEARSKLRNLIRYYMGKKHPFTACVRDNTKRFGKERAERICATLKDIGTGTTKWRNRGKAVDDVDDMCLALFEAADGDVDGLVEMFEADQTASKSVEVEVPRDDLDGFDEGHLKAVWTTAYVNDLPDSAFLYVESGDKDDEGKTVPRSKRHFPYRSVDGKIDLPHLRNALSRIPQSNLPEDVKSRATAKAQRLLDAQKSTQPAREGPDPLRRKADDLALEVKSGGASLSKPPRQVEPEPRFDTVELRRKARNTEADVLSGFLMD